MTPSAQLCEEAARACKAAGSMRPLKRKGPLQFEVDLRSDELAAALRRWGLTQQGRTISWSAADIVEGFDTLNKVTFFTPATYPLRRPMLCLLRGYFGLRSRWLCRTPDSEGAPMP